MKYLFPPEELRAVRIAGRKEWIVFYREKSQRWIETYTGPTDRIHIAGLAVAAKPVFELFDMKCKARPGFFEFKTRAAKPAKIDIESEAALRIIEAGVILGESYAKHEPNGHKIAKGGNLDLLMQRTLCWFLWPIFSGDAFLKKCGEQGIKPLHAAAEMMGDVGNRITAEALRKHLSRLRLPLPTKPRGK
jgi:hypothetical protein